MPRATRFPTGLQTGRDTGVPSTSTIGNVLQTVECTVTDAAPDTQVYVPPNSYPVNWNVVVTDADASAQGVNINFGIPGNDTRYGSSLVSAATLLIGPTAVSGKAWKEGFGTSAANTITVKATAAFAISGFEAIARITYIIKDA